MSSIREDLKALGDDENKVANTLRSLGIKGERFGAHSCPIFNYLKRQGHTNVIGVDEDGVIIMRYLVSGLPMEHRGSIPYAASSFIFWFDHGSYSDLEG
jgi:hypothetical protein